MGPGGVMSAANGRCRAGSLTIRVVGELAPHAPGVASRDEGARAGRASAAVGEDRPASSELGEVMGVETGAPEVDEIEVDRINPGAPEVGAAEVGLADLLGGLEVSFVEVVGV